MTEQQSNIQTPVNNDDLAGTINLHDIIRMVVVNWYWFVLSVLVCIGAAYYYLAKTPKIYNRTATILVKDTRKGGDIDLSAFSDLATRRCSLSQLARYPLACIGQDSSTYNFYQQFFTSNGLSFRVDIEVATMDQILPVVEHGLGVGFYPEQLVAPRIARGELFCIPLDQPVPERAITLVEDTARPRSTAMKAIRELICGKG